VLNCIYMYRRMPQPRRTQIDIDATPFYHCIGRCVRRAFLCGADRATGQSFDHRKGWVVELLATLTDIFAIDLCAYAVLSNHYHLVTRLDGDRARAWSAEEVVDRYRRLFAGTVEARLTLPPAQVAEWIACWRARLYDLSWFMRCLNEAIARRANAEDRCTGRFWEGRFRSQALLDAAGLLTCMAYVDLNPIRAGLAPCLEGCDFTSIQQRLAGAPPCGVPPDPAHAAGRPPADAREAPGSPTSERPTAAGRAPALWPFADAAPAAADPLPLEFSAYRELLTATGAVLRCEPTAHLPDTSRRLLEGLGIVSEHWRECIENYTRHFFAMVGGVHSIDVYCARTDRDHAKGRTWAAQAFRTAA
jgi:hypothetical protein